MPTDLPDFPASPSPSPSRSNWSGNYYYTAARLWEPASVGEVQEAVLQARHIRALGTRHSFNGIADSEAQISLKHLRDVVIDAPGRTARVGAGIRYGDLALALDAEGMALGNMASLPHISVGGAVATATHGSGLGNGGLATEVIGLEFVAADGSLRTLSRSTDRERFPGAVVGLGALGVVTHLTLALQPRFEVVQTVYEGLPFAELEQHLGEVMAAGYSVSLFTDWQSGRVNQVWVKSRVGPGQASPPAAEIFGARRASRKLHPLPEQPADACTDQGMVAGPWYERLPHFRLDFQPSHGEELQSEYFVPFEHGYEAIRAVEGLRQRLGPVLYITELRAVAADDLWMSMAYGRTSLAIHFTWRLEWDRVQEVLPWVEAALEPFGARPHWGKVFTRTGGELGSRYPRLSSFRELRREIDPEGKFLNGFAAGLL